MSSFNFSPFLAEKLKQSSSPEIFIQPRFVDGTATGFVWAIVLLGSASLLPSSGGAEAGSNSRCRRYTHLSLPVKRILESAGYAKPKTWSTYSASQEDVKRICGSKLRPSSLLNATSTPWGSTKRRTASTGEARMWAWSEAA